MRIFDVAHVIAELVLLQVEIEDRNQAHSEVTKESTTAQPALPAPVTERLPEPMEVERKDNMLVDDNMTLEEFGKELQKDQFQQKQVCLKNPRSRKLNLRSKHPNLKR